MKPDFHSAQWCLRLLLGLVGYLAGLEIAVGGQECEVQAAQAASIQGQVERLAAGQKRWGAVQLGEPVCEGDSIRVGANSRVALVLVNDTILRLDQHTTVTFSRMQHGAPAWLDLVNGVAHFISRIRQSFEVVTPFVNAAVEGTEFVIAVRAQVAEVTVIEGRVTARNRQGELTLSAGRSATAAAGQAPALRTEVRPRAAVHWALYYPPVLGPEGLAFDDLPDRWRRAVEQSLAAYRARDASAALGPIEPIARNREELAPVYLYRAALYLSVGRVEEASQDLTALEGFNVNQSEVLALRSMIAVVQNEPEVGFSLASAAVTADPANPTSALALSYAQQARFDVEGARATLKSAVEEHPENPLLWSRLAEMHLAVGELDASLTAAQQAVQRGPELALTQSVLGFAHLARIEIASAEQVFRRAIKLDQANPLPRLGLGLAVIRRGDLEAGRRQIELAASLDPNNALVRSYLGKAYFDEKRDDIAAAEFALAKELDPNDPTPWFYDALRKQTENRPIEALQDLQKSIELNHNRAVYRSKFLLDRDLASRSASLARIYADLNFDQLALVEGWKSVNTDPGNYSAHRLLSDSYATLPRHQIARVSELLQSQLLQPLNLTPLQPELAEANLLLYEGLGPSDPALLEFNPLFTRNRLALQGSALIGGNDTLGNNLIHSGIHDNWSYSIGQYYYRTDGFRDNGDQRQKVFNLFVQNAVSFNTSVQAEVRISDVDLGDPALRFDPDDFSETRDEDLEARTYRVGFHHSFNPRSELIGSVIWADREDTLKQSEFPALRIDLERDGYLAEVQQLFRYKQLHLTGGVGRFDGDVREKLKLDFGPIFEPTKTRETTDLEHNNLYLYTQADVLKNATLVGGLSYDDYEDSVIDRDQWNPKIGALWDITDATTLRAAAFRVLTRTVISEQTIEPTQVAGFNQFFDDSEGSKSKRYGVALDHRMSSRLYGGVEYSQRDIDAYLPVVSLPPAASRVDIADSEERLARAYLYWTLNQTFALSAEYQYEDVKRDRDYPPELLSGIRFTELETHRVPIGVVMHHPSGWFAGLKATYVDQQGEFLDSFLLPTGQQQDDFWVLDASIGYRLPKRYGLVSVGVKNLSDESFRFQDIDPISPTFYPERLMFGRLTVAF